MVVIKKEDELILGEDRINELASLRYDRLVESGSLEKYVKTEFANDLKDVIAKSPSKDLAIAKLKMTELDDKLIIAFNQELKKQIQRMPILVAWDIADKSIEPLRKARRKAHHDMFPDVEQKAAPTPKWYGNSSTNTSKK